MISPPIEVGETYINVKSSDLDPQELRSNLLFWDRLDFPELSSVLFKLSLDSEFLLNAGILQRTRVAFSGTAGIGAIVRDGHLAAFSHLDQREPGRWSIAGGERSISFPSESLAPGRGVLVRLYNALPVPNKDVPLSDILNFREKRRDELLALRTHLEELYQRVINAGDGPLAWGSQLEMLQRAIRDHIKASRESKMALRIATMEAELNLVPIATTAIAAHTQGLPMVPSLITGVAAGIALNVGAALKKREAVATPFKYITSYHREVFNAE